MSRRLLPYLCLVAGGLGGCSTTEPALLSIAGCWAQEIGIPGAALVLQLFETPPTSIGGTGHYAMEAGRSGSLSVTGERASADFGVTITYDSGTVLVVSATIRGNDRFDARYLSIDGHPLSSQAVFRRCR